jgi:hypothetical protein
MQIQSCRTVPLKEKIFFQNVGYKAERRETRTPSPRSAEHRHQTSASGGNNYAVLTRTTGASAPTAADSWSGHIYPPLLKQTSWPDGDSVQHQQQQQQQQFPPETFPAHQEAVRNSNAAAATGQPTGRSPGHAMTEQRGAFSERHQQVAAAAKPKAFAAAAGEPDKFRALERLNHLASRLRQQLPPSAAGVELSGGKDHPTVQAPPRTHHHHQHRVQLKGPGSKSDSDSGFGGDAASTAGTADHKIKQVRGSLFCRVFKSF